MQVTDEGDQVCLSVRDDGDASKAGHPSPGYGVVGMAERAALLGGALQAGPGLDRGWTVNAALPKRGATA